MGNHKNYNLTVPHTPSLQRRENLGKVPQEEGAGGLLGEGKGVGAGMLPGE